jgi:hypothetical protein
MGERSVHRERGEEEEKENLWPSITNSEVA